MISQTIKENKIFENLSEGELYEHAVRNGEANILSTGALAVNTGYHTARAAKDKFIVKEHQSAKNIWWGENNKPIDEASFNSLYGKLKNYLSSKNVYLRKCRVGAGDHALNLHVWTEYAWHSLFVKNLFRNSQEQFHKPDFTIISAPGFKADPFFDKTRSDTFIIVNFAKKLAIIGGTGYAGEIKKTAFTVMNYLLPLKKVFPMHCSANVGKDGDTALFFGLSGTGKTTLSSDPQRGLIGDDEHGWDEKGIFNFEGGCYAKVINLSKEAEPQIYSAVNRFGTVLENVVFDKNGMPNFSDGSRTENTRAGYPLHFIDNAVEGDVFGHPKNILMLTYDAFGVLPPVAKLDYNQAMYHFISGYTAKVANTEIGIKEPKATFSACFGAPFMSWHPSVYAQLLAEKMGKYKSECWLINTGLCGGPYGIGKRISIKDTRAIVNFAISGDKSSVKYEKDPVFGFEIPLTFGSADAAILNPSSAWKDKEEYNLKKKELAKMFAENFKKFSVADKGIISGGPSL